MMGGLPGVGCPFPIWNESFISKML